MTISYLEAHGDAHHIGLAIGEHTRHKIDAVLERYAEWYALRATPFETLTARALGYIAQAMQAQFPIVSELEGIAHGSNHRLDEIFLLTCIEELDLPDGDHCTTLALRCKDGVVLGHNEDWNWRYRDGLYVVKARPLDRPAFVSAAYAGTPPGSIAGLNEYGVAFAADSLALKERGAGIPKNIFMRRILQCANLPSVFSCALQSERVIGNTLVIATEHEAVSIEMCASSYDSAGMANGVLCHTNHALTESIASVSAKPKKRSLVRYERASRLLLHARNESDLQRILANHQGKHPVCRHRGGQRTIASVIALPSSRELRVCNGNPCEGTYETYRL
ncbi:hypothetical protein HY642_01280 [Candidatus Woesearchaeota archaeon]|nr:hypothetical protein [Candidatus Woesearchaeota archaeon]